MENAIKDIRELFKSNRWVISEYGADLPSELHFDEVGHLLNIIFSAISMSLFVVSRLLEKERI